MNESVLQMSQISPDISSFFGVFQVANFSKFSRSTFMLADIFR
jgi:hypothetical protein